MPYYIYIYIYIHIYIYIYIYIYTISYRNKILSKKIRRKVFQGLSAKKVCFDGLLKDIFLEVQNETCS